MNRPLSIVSTGPPPLMRIDLDERSHPDVPAIDEMQLFRDLIAADIGLSLLELARCRWRGVSFDRFERVMMTGIDVEPTTKHFYADGFDKAMEYGGWPKLVLGLAVDALRHTGRQVPADIPADELRSLQRDYQTTLPSNDGKWLWLSRIPRGDTAVGTQYERDYGRWIDGDPSAALRVVLLVTHALRGGGSSTNPTLDAWAAKQSESSSGSRLSARRRA